MNEKNYTLDKGKAGVTAICKHCTWHGGPYKTEVIAKRMGQCHVVKAHPELEQPAHVKPKRKYTKRQPSAAPQATVNFCPCCGTNLKAVSVAITL